MDICCPPTRLSTGLTKLSDRPIERVWDGVQVQLAVPEDCSIDSLRDERSVHVVHGPDRETQRHLQRLLRGTYHIVAMTLLKPTKSIVAARLMASSGWYSSVLAVSHALR
jgi:hypothetical protein